MSRARKIFAEFMLDERGEKQAEAYADDLLKRLKKGGLAIIPQAYLNQLYKLLAKKIGDAREDHMGEPAKISACLNRLSKKTVELITDLELPEFSAEAFFVNCGQTD